MAEKKQSTFEQLYSINVNDRTEKKNGLTYLSWSWAWGEVKKVDPNANYTIYENADGWNYHTDGKTAWVKTGVTINGIEHIEYLPVMDYRNQSIPLEKITSFDVNKTIQRSLTKACARHGLALYLYSGEDLPESEEEAKAKQPKKAEKPKAEKKPEKSDDDLKAELKGLLMETESDTLAFLGWASKRYKRELKAVDEMNRAELEDAIPMVASKKGNK